MRRAQRLLAMVMLGTLLYGCSRKEDHSDTNAPATAKSAEQVSESDHTMGEKQVRPSQPVATSVTLNDVLASWEAGDKDKAMAQFLSIKWDNASLFRDIEAFGIPEQQYVSLSEDQREPIMQEAMGVSRSVRALAKRIVAAADGLAASGHIETAKSRYEAVLQCGERWQSPEYLEVLQLVGKGMTTLAENRLSALK